MFQSARRMALLCDLSLFCRAGRLACFNPPGGWLCYATIKNRVKRKKCFSFNPPGGWLCYATQVDPIFLKEQITVSIRQADGFAMRHLFSGGGDLTAICFNPPGGWLCYATVASNDYRLIVERFQSARRMALLCDHCLPTGARRQQLVSIRQADGFAMRLYWSEPPRCVRSTFQSARRMALLCDSGGAR